MAEYGKSCCGCCPPDCEEHINLRSGERHYVKIQGMDGRESFLLMSTDFAKTMAFANELTELINKYLPKMAYVPHCALGTVDKYMKSKYEEVWQKIEKGEAIRYGYDPFDY